MAEGKTIKLVRIVSNNLCYGPEPDSSDEIEQHLTIKADGQYWLSRYEYGAGPGSYSLSQKLHGRMYDGKVNGIFKLFEKYYAADILVPMTKDSGKWELQLTFEDGTSKAYVGSPADRNKLLSAAGKMIRTELDLFDLFLFDGEISYPTYEHGPIHIFEKYLPLLYENTYLWNRFSELCHQYFRQNRKEYFAFNRNPDNINIWLAFLDNMGGGVPLYFYSAAAFIILSYKDAGNDIDAELKKITTAQTDS